MSFMTFKENSYQIIKNFLEPDFVLFIQDYFALKINAGTSIMDEGQVYGSHSFYGDYLVETILQNSCESISKIINIKIVPTYSYARCYMKGDELEIHRDRESCEISATISLGHSNDFPTNPIYFSKNSDKSESTEVILNPGDLCLYRGCDLWHWRPPVENKWHLQAFLHFVDSEGKNKEFIYDQRPYLGFEKIDK
jgi:hypothetical protein